MNLITVQPEQIEAVFKAKGFKWFSLSEPWNVNLWGVRKAGIDNSNAFDDVLGLTYADEALKLCHHVFTGTTNPGIYYRKNPMNAKGTAILLPGQYQGAFKIGLHHGNWALVQNKPLPVWRDTDKDETIEASEWVDTGYHALNFHQMFGSTSTIAASDIHKWSAGCQGLNDPKQWAAFKRVIQKSAKLYGPVFTYTLLQEDWIK